MLEERKTHGLHTFTQKKKKNEGVIPQNFVKRGGLKIR